jgi:hypothetical protein
MAFTFLVALWSGRWIRRGNHTAATLSAIDHEQC